MSDYSITLQIDYHVYEEWKQTLDDDEDVSDRVEEMMMADFLRHYFETLD